ncbi:16S rRNA (cytosine(967)-C(5))-methyltransferase [Aliidiomarina minuta]|uniref:16S rRNA (cytosine(967)-C(5))-methyltransferase n=1 Tax=Aliidiomarina minuta TaxID=880057 RepID=A0A432WA21_9GAMM|nr:16S rRNA (cytosine(967)-C(5))-methyltransferase RsmB [Aliidiomarina minuta]RUO26964.1 16S rRNA (cytosine(967)-C(5))-methyltransferase [Aliidiomarina minuta]
MNNAATARAAAAFCLQQVLQHERSLNQVMPEAQQKFSLSAGDKAFTQAIVFGVLRDLPALEWLVQQALDKPLRSKLRVIHYLILVGLQQLRSMRTASHAAIAETVNACALLRQKALKGLVNAVLRNYQRQQESLEAQLASLPDKILGHPGWLLRRLKETYPEYWPAIVAANNTQAPMWLRVNIRHHSVAEYAHLLQQQGLESTTQPGLEQAICLQHPVDVHSLPGFSEGWVSVQDGAAQYAAQLLNAQPGERILDACAAPGGKTAHILERCDCQVSALDIDATRLTRVEENLQRLQLHANCQQGDAANPDTWWDGQQFDRILLDAPCSATGVIRRHPDIKWLRRDSDIDQLTELQAQILACQWQLLKPGGTLLYATCSVLPQENHQQVAAFLASHPDAYYDPLYADDESGWQLRPGQNNLDGFFYARLQKQE